MQPVSVPSFLTILSSGLRLALLRQPRRSATTAGAGVFIALIAIYVAVSLGLDLVQIRPPWRFTPAGLLTVLCDSVLTLIAAWILVVLSGRAAVLWGAASILLSATIATALVVHWPLATLASALARADHALLADTVDFISRAWWFLILLVFAHWLAPRAMGRTTAAAVLAYAVSAAPWWFLPTPTFFWPVHDAVPAAPATPAPLVPANPLIPEPAPDVTPAAPDFDAEELMYRQPALVDQALARLKAQRPGRIDLYAIAFAGDAEENVFRNEAEYLEQLLARRFDAQGRIVVLENNSATITSRPLATWTNLHRVLEAVARKMDPEQDILLLYLTTHGSADHELLVDLDPLPLNQIAPRDLADALKTTPAVRWKVIIVNACYSGGFIGTLRDDSTMVITSARADRTSFGCGAKSDITYFGKAFLVEALNRTTSLREAFDIAAHTVTKWENVDKEEHSEPQIATTPSIEAKLAAWRRELPAADEVGFRPAGSATRRR